MARSAGKRTSANALELAQPGEINDRFIAGVGHGAQSRVKTQNLPASHARMKTRPLRDRTIASAYSVRPRPQATVSMPLAWDELPDVTPLDFTVGSAGRRFAEIGDRHARIDAEAYDLTPVLEWYARDERDHGLGDLPYPPEYPKMPGEPKRVQPSRDTLRPKD